MVSAHSEPADERPAAGPGHLDRGKAARAWAVALVYMALIFWTSSQPALQVQIPKEWQFRMMDKAGHFLEYAVLGLLVSRALRASGAERRTRWVALVTILYGGSDELHQALVPYRTCELGDWLADCAGGLFAAWLTRAR